MTRMGRVPPESQARPFQGRIRHLLQYRARIQATKDFEHLLRVAFLERARCGDDDPREPVREDARHFARPFPGHGPEDQHCFPGKYPVEGIHQAADGERCMSAVQDNMAGWLPSPPFAPGRML